MASRKIISLFLDNKHKRNLQIQWQDKSVLDEQQEVESVWREM